MFQFLVTLTAKPTVMLIFQLLTGLRYVTLLDMPAYKHRSLYY